MIFVSSCEKFTVEQQNSDWKESPKNPIIKISAQTDSMLWDNPFVMKIDSATYYMWLAGKKYDEQSKSQIYFAKSSNGIDWQIDTNVALKTAYTGEWDDLEVTAPTVVKLGTKYHMYFAGISNSDTPKNYSIGHATSDNGIEWQKDLNNPILTPHQNETQWGYLQTHQPGAMVYENKIYLYFATTKKSETYSEDVRKIERGIMLAISSDGRNFETQDQPVLTLSENYSTEEFFTGYSSPQPFLDSLGTFHLLYEVVQYQDKTTPRCVALSHATSRDGLLFTEKEYSFFTAGNSDWKNYEVFSPTAFQDGDIYKLWFAGKNELFFQEGFSYGIGYANRPK